MAPLSEGPDGSRKEEYPRRGANPPVMGRGLFVSFEGEDKSGKSTQAALLAEELSRRGLPVLLTREPGGTELGERLREILLQGGGFGAWSEALLYAADRAEHVRSVILPALEAGRMVIADRYLDSSLAYQGYGLGLPVERLRQLNDWATGALRPRRTFLLLAGEETVRERGGGGDRIEGRDPGYRERVREGFRALAAAEPERFVILGPATVEERARIIREDVLQLWEGTR